jgi:hypothetical protein
LKTIARQNIQFSPDTSSTFWPALPTIVTSYFSHTPKLGKDFAFFDERHEGMI